MDRGGWWTTAYGVGELDMNEQLTHICMAESLLCLPEAITTLLTGYDPTQNKEFFLNSSKFFMVKSQIFLGKCHIALENMWVIFEYLLILISNIITQ